MQQYNSTMELLQQDGDLGPAEKVKLLASLADAYNKTVAANARILPETSKLATALEVVELLVQFVSEKHPKQLGALAEVLEPFGIRELISSGQIALNRGPKTMAPSVR